MKTRARADASARERPRPSKAAAAVVVAGAPPCPEIPGRRTTWWPPLDARRRRRRTRSAAHDALTARRTWYGLPMHRRLHHHQHTAAALSAVSDGAAALCRLSRLAQESHQKVHAVSWVFAAILCQTLVQYLLATILCFFLFSRTSKWATLQHSLAGYRCKMDTMKLLIST